jgi:hypothetical protein
VVSSLGRTACAFRTPTDVAVVDAEGTAVRHVCDTLNKRIVRVKLGYAASDSVPVSVAAAQRK